MNTQIVLIGLWSVWSARHRMESNLNGYSYTGYSRIWIR